MTLPEKIADKTEPEKLAAIDSNIENCLKILRQEIDKRKKLTPMFWNYKKIDEGLEELSYWSKTLIRSESLTER